MSEAVDQTGNRSMPLSRNTRTALILATVALAFFAGIILKYWLIR